MMCHRLSYPTPDDETEVVRRSLKLKLKREGEGAIPMSAFDAIQDDRQLSIRDLTEAMGAVQEVHVSEVFIRDCVDLIRRTRNHPNIELGCSPRAVISMVQAARARSYLAGRAYAVPEDLFALAEDVILHRIRLTYEAIADGITPRSVLRDLLDDVG